MIRVDNEQRDEVIEKIKKAKKDLAAAGGNTNRHRDVAKYLKRLYKQMRDIEEGRSCEG